MQYSESNPVCAEFHFSALRHGEYMLWAKLWCVVCVGAPSKNCSENYFDVEIRSVEISHARPDNYSYFFSRILDICGPYATCSMADTVTETTRAAWQECEE